MLRILLVAALIAAALVAVKQQHVLQRAGLLGSCTVVTSPPHDAGEWHACKGGRLSGPPDLSRDSCKSYGLQGSFEYWRCPAHIERSPIRG